MTGKMTREDALIERQKERDLVIDAALEHVPFDGWTWKALRRGAKDAGFRAAAADRLFPEGLREAAYHFADLSDRRMLERLSELDLDSMRIRDRVSAGVRCRIEVNAHHREAVRRLAAFMALPPNAPHVLRMTWRTCDHIWYAAGDRAADWNHYTKRGLLAPVYTTTMLYWLGDQSENFEATWSYLERRISDVLKIPKYQAKAREAATRLPNPFKLLRRLRPAG